MDLRAAPCNLVVSEGYNHGYLQITSWVDKGGRKSCSGLFKNLPMIPTTFEEYYSNHHITSNHHTTVGEHVEPSKRTSLCPYDSVRGGRSYDWSRCSHIIRLHVLIPGWSGKSYDNFPNQQTTWPQIPYVRLDVWFLHGTYSDHDSCEFPHHPALATN